jgi:hypothetical protein
VRRTGFDAPGRARSIAMPAMFSRTCSAEPVQLRESRAKGFKFETRVVTKRSATQADRRSRFATDPHSP